MHAVPLVHSDYFTGEFLPKFDMKNIDFDLCKGFFLWKILPKFARFQKEKNSKSPDFYDKFQYVAKNIEGFCFFFFFSPTSISSMYLNLAKLFSG
jgi:hypothetical protein